MLLVQIYLQLPFPDEDLSEPLLLILSPLTPARRGMEDRLRGCHYLFRGLGLMPSHPLTVRTEDTAVITVLNGWTTCAAVHQACPGVLGNELHRGCG